MREYIVYIWVGVWLLLVPFFGIPGTWKDVLVIITALGILGYSYLGYRRTNQEEAHQDVVVSEPPQDSHNSSATPEAGN